MIPERMDTCVIVGAGDCDPASLPSGRDRYYYIAADAGIRHLQAAGITPDLFIGDLDSLGAPPGSVRTKILPVIKDLTDTAAACEEGLRMGFRKFELYGALGGRRFSHSVANVQLLLNLKKRQAEGVIRDAACTLCILSSGETRTLEPCRFFSLFSLTGAAEVSIRHALYELDRGTLTYDFPLGVSNEPRGIPEVTVHTGDVLLVTE
ncbi:MAG: thiamine diphosphokinase, partial [Lachnospiraceae bacterium]|nr:thiamine diphosphokinase [Lachnospiraceae bacterium]